MGVFASTSMLCIAKFCCNGRTFTNVRPQRCLYRIQGRVQFGQSDWARIHHDTELSGRKLVQKREPWDTRIVSDMISLIKARRASAPEKAVAMEWMAGGSVCSGCLLFHQPLTHQSKAQANAQANLASNLRVNPLMCDPASSAGADG